MMEHKRNRGHTTEAHRVGYKVKMEGLAELPEQSSLCTMENFPLISINIFTVDTLKTNLEDTMVHISQMTSTGTHEFHGFKL